jgi:hypothetical protein
VAVADAVAVAEDVSVSVAVAAGDDVVDMVPLGDTDVEGVGSALIVADDVREDVLVVLGVAATGMSAMW